MSHTHAQRCQRRALPAGHEATRTDAARVGGRKMKSAPPAHAYRRGNQGALAKRPALVKQTAPLPGQGKIEPDARVSGQQGITCHGAGGVVAVFGGGHAGPQIAAAIR